MSMFDEAILIPSCKFLHHLLRTISLKLYLELIVSYFVEHVPVIHKNSTFSAIHFNSINDKIKNFTSKLPTFIKSVSVNY